MIKLMKYEFRKLRTVLLIMVGALVVLEACYLIGDRIGSYRLTGVSLGLLMALVFAVYIYILIAGMVSYARELNDKTGYMTFMTPVSPLGIVVSKLLFTILASVVVTALFGTAVYYDLSKQFAELELSGDVMRSLDFTFTLFTGSLGSNITLMKVILNLALEAGAVLISILLTLCTSYLAVTVILFFALSFGTGKVSELVVHDGVIETTEQLLSRLGAQAAVDFAFAALFAGASAWLLDRKVSL